MEGLFLWDLGNRDKRAKWVYEGPDLYVSIED